MIKTLFELVFKVFLSTWSLFCSDLFAKCFCQRDLFFVRTCLQSLFVNMITFLFQLVCKVVLSTWSLLYSNFLQSLFVNVITSLFELVRKVNMITTTTNKGKTVQIFKQHENLTLARNSARYVGMGKTIRWNGSKYSTFLTSSTYLFAVLMMKISPVLSAWWSSEWTPTILGLRKLLIWHHSPSDHLNNDHNVDK